MKSYSAADYLMKNGHPRYDAELLTTSGYYVSPPPPSFLLKRKLILQIIELIDDELTKYINN